MNSKSIGLVIALFLLIFHVSPAIQANAISPIHENDLNDYMKNASSSKETPSSIIPDEDLDSFLFASSTQESYRYQRVAGSNRLDTAIRIAQLGWKNADTVIIARADDPADALAASGLSGVYDAPILLTFSNKMDQVVKDELKRLKAKKVFVLGGEQAISRDVFKTIESLGGITPVRISGSTRYETAYKINQEAGLDKGNIAIIANGKTVADALSASGISAIDQVPIYLATNKTLPIGLPASINEVHIYGGPFAIGTEIEDSLRKNGLRVKRVSGKDRYDTNLQANQVKRENAIIVRGTSVKSNKEDYPDAVAASGLAQKFNANIILSHSERPVNKVAEYFMQNKFKNIYVIGGENAISTLVALDLVEHPESVLNLLFDMSVSDMTIHPDHSIAYVISDEDNALYAIDYETHNYSTIDLNNDLNLYPESIIFKNNKLFVTMVSGNRSSFWWNEYQYGAVAVVDSKKMVLDKFIPTKIDPFDIAADDKGHVYVSSGSGQWTTLRSYSVESGKEISSHYIRQASFMDIHPQMNKLYTITTESSPRDFNAYLIDQGKIIANYDSPYHGEHRMHTYFKISPDGKYLFNGSGRIFESKSDSKDDMQYVTTMEEFSAITFNLNNQEFFTTMDEYPDYILEYDYNSLEMVDFYETYGNTVKMHYQNNKVIMLTEFFSEETPEYALEILPLSDLR